MDVGVQADFRRLLRNQAFYGYDIKKQLRIVSGYLQMGLTRDRINQLIEEVKTEEREGRLLFPVLVDISSVNQSNINVPGWSSMRQTDIDAILALLNNRPLLYGTSGADAFSYLRMSLKISFDNFNSIVEHLWQLINKKGPVPLLEFGRNGEYRFVKAFREEIKRNSLQNNGLIKLKDALIELDDFLHSSLMEFRNYELFQFGATGVLLDPIHNIIEEVIDYMDLLDDSIMSGQKFPLPMAAYVDIYTSWSDRLYNIQIHAVNLGKRCSNKETPIYNIPIDELKDGEFVRLSNQICWENEELIEYIKTRGGRNDASNMKTYPSSRIWETESDFHKILQIPQGKKSGFSKWLKEVTGVGLANRVSDLTLHKMYVTASVLTSKGRAFREIAWKEVSQDPKLLIEWQRLNQDADDIGTIRNKKIKTELQRAVVTSLKSTSIAEFRAYYKDITQDERDALKTFDPHLEGLIERCYDGKECNTLIAIRNQVARLKKIPIINLESD
jgi:hypothetical protein